MQDNKAYIQSLIRVNHAGEYGAKRIYEGQLKYLKDKKDIALVKNMYQQELKHLEYFANQAVKQDVRPTILMLLWHRLGYALGALSALLGKKTAMACTVAVEEVIEEHYQQQINKLKKLPKERKLLEKIKQFQAEEVEHKELGIEHDALNAVFYNVFTAVIKKASELAIYISKKI